MAEPIVPLLSTKFHAPRPHNETVVRETLLNRLDAIPHHRLILLSAPAGFGKSTLMGAWLQRSGMDVAWISLDARDDDLSRFLTYVVSSIESLYPGIGVDLLDALAVTPNPQTEPLMGALVNGLASLPSHFLLVLDDFHLVTSDQVVDSVRFLIDHAPDNVHVVILTRSDPPIPLSRLRVSGRLMEIRAADLRFTTDETAALLATMGLTLDRDLVCALQEKTEGWIAGLKMAALSLHGRDNADAFVEAFTGADRYVLEYLLEEVVGGQTDEIQETISALAVLETFSGPLVEAVTGVQDGQAFLDELDRANLFLVPLDNRREWYRYHHLFADLLGHRLRRNYADRLPIYHRRAAEWFDGQQMVRQAIQHAHRTGDGTLLRSILEKYWLRAFRDFTGGELEQLCDLGEETLRSSPRLAFLRCYGLYDQRDHAGMSALFPIIEDSLAHDPHNRELMGGLALLRAIVARDRGEYAEALHQGEQALALLPDRQVSDPDYQWNLSRGMVLSFLAQGNAAIGNRDEALRRVHLAWTYAQTRGDFRTLIYSLINLASDAWAVGDVDETLRYCDKLLAEDDRMALIAPHQRLLPRQMRASAHYLRNELDAALQWGLEALSFTPQAGSAVYAAETYRILSLIYDALNDPEGVDRSLQALDAVHVAVPRHQWIIPMIRARIDLAHGHPSAGRAWVNGYLTDGPDGLPYLPSPNANERLLALVFYSRLRIVEGDRWDALRILDAVLPETEKEDHFKLRLEALLLRGLALEQLGKTDDALETVTRAITMCSSQRVIRPFVAEGEIIRGIVARALRSNTLVQTVSPGYLRLLVAACGLEPDGLERDRSKTAQGPGDWDLTERETEILRLISLGYSNRRIAERLYLSVNTVKTHAANLYDKLGVNSRTEAIARASAAGVL